MPQDHYNARTETAVKNRNVGSRGGSEGTQRKCFGNREVRVKVKRGMFGGFTLYAQNPY